PERRSNDDDRPVPAAETAPETAAKAASPDGGGGERGRGDGQNQQADCDCQPFHTNPPGDETSKPDATLASPDPVTKSRLLRRIEDRWPNPRDSVLTSRKRTASSGGIARSS